MGMLGILLALAAAPLAAMAAPATDILPPGRRAVRHELVVVGIENAGGWRFLAAPQRGFHGLELVEVGKPFVFSSKYGTRLWGLRADEPMPSAYTAEWTADRVSASLPPEVTSTPLGSPLARVRTELRITGVSANGIGLEVLETREFDAHGGELSSAWRLWLVAIAAVGAAGLFGIWRATRHAAAKPA